MSNWQPVPKKKLSELPTTIEKLDTCSLYVAELFATVYAHLTGEPIGPICQTFTTMIWNRYLKTQTDPKRFN